MLQEPEYVALQSTAVACYILSQREAFAGRSLEQVCDKMQEQVHQIC